MLLSETTAGYQRKYTNEPVLQSNVEGKVGATASHKTRLAVGAVLRKYDRPCAVVLLWAREPEGDAGSASRW